VLVLKELLATIGIEPERLQILWVSSAEGPRFAREITRYIEEIRALGPLGRPSVQMRSPMGS